MKKRVVIFGAGGIGKRICNMVSHEFNVIGMVDNDSQKWEKKCVVL